MSQIIQFKALNDDFLTIKSFLNKYPGDLDDMFRDRDYDLLFMVYDEVEDNKGKANPIQAEQMKELRDMINSYVKFRSDYNYTIDDFAV